MALCVVALAASAADPITVAKGGSARIGIDLGGLRTTGSASAALFGRTLENDLIRSGWFKVTRTGRGEYVVAGDAAVSSSQLTVQLALTEFGSGRKRLGKTYRGGPGGAAALAHAASDDIVLAVTDRRGMASSRIVLVGTRSGHKELYLCDADGANLMQITRDKSISASPKWGPDGKSLVYTSYRLRYPDVYRIDLKTGKRERIAKFPGVNTGAAIDPSGRDVVITLSKDGNPELYVMTVEGKRLTRLTTTPKVAETSGSWSPDGRQIVFVSDRGGKPQLYTMRRDGGKSRQLTWRGSENVDPDWGPDGRIVYASKQGRVYQVFVYSPDGHRHEQVTTDNADHEDPSWAPDGRHVVYTRTVNFRSRLYVLDTVTGAEVPLFDNSGDWYSPAWSR